MEADFSSNFVPGRFADALLPHPREQEDVRMQNMLAAKAIADAVRTSLGAQGPGRTFSRRDCASAAPESRRTRATTR